MKRFKTIFYILYFLFLVVSVFLIFYYDFIRVRFTTQSYVNFLQFWALLGLVIFLTEWIVENIHIKRLKGRISKLEKDNLNLKAKLFDQEEEKREIDRSIHSFDESIKKKEDKEIKENKENKEKPEGRKGETE